MENNLTYGTALEAVKEGKLIARDGWNGKGMFVFQRKEVQMNIDLLLSLNTLPKGVKDYYERKHQPIIYPHDVQIVFSPYLCMKTVDDKIVNGWLPSQTDMLANDWCILS